VSPSGAKWPISSGFAPPSAVASAFLHEARFEAFGQRVGNDGTNTGRSAGTIAQRRFWSFRPVQAYSSDRKVEMSYSHDRIGAE
jgi:hypothetical protein